MPKGTGGEKIGAGDRSITEKARPLIRRK